MIKSRWRPKIPKAVPKYLDKPEQARINLHADQLSIRDRAIFEYLLSSGCRRCELVTLNVTDVDLKNRTAWVTGKGQKKRQVHFSPLCALYLQKYLETHPPHEQALFLNRFGKRLKGRSIYYLTAKLGRQAKLGSNLGPHRLRHTFATNLLAKGAELDFISDELGHSNLSTTRIYARLPAEQIVSLYKKFMG
ncbi:tyrosine-type recombinase/integrase [Desulfotruncus alcoholivorax]|uniref:tyrosine-type recombinase/integrase n=1 Tax=Desulfotruncus alcoholivorax TaxID=265477 RepID=UPI000687DB06|nr:tyrosine-type recombinase/integrase [Desulfotruncus alcoholivorax]